MFGTISYSKKIFLILMGTSLLITLVSMIVSIFFTLANSQDALAGKLKSVSYMLAESSKQALHFKNPQMLSETLHKVASIAKANQITIFDIKGDVFTYYNPEELTLPHAHKDEKFIMDSQYIEFYMMIMDKNRSIGSLHMKADLSNYKDDIFQRTLYIGLLFLGLLIFVYIFAKKMQKFLSEPIYSLAKAAALIRDEQNFGIRVSTSQQSEEIVLLYETFNEMLSKMERREIQRDVAEEEARKYQAHLELLAEDLEERVSKRTQHLQEAQRQLVESEKMAALGNLVGGVAHEVNTPLGNAITSLSVLTDTTKKLQSALDQDNLKRSELVKGLTLLEESSRMIFSSVHRAANLIRSFKQISIDQINDERREFDLRSYSQEVFTTFRGSLKQANVSWEIIIDEDKRVDSYPGIYAQILSNLIQNSLLHAFEGISDPKICLEINVEDAIVSLAFKDNGVGIAPEIRDMIFEPFVTTKRNQGGSGLGLNIVYNLVTQKLGGTMKVDSQVGQGSLFTITFTI
jgi:signal transduction histidine kinase